ncbi:MAG: NUDIX hydrolase [bacterium]|nr:NUDIX hydrolase [bacterium]
MESEIAAGGVVFRRAAGGPEVLMIRDRFGCWTLPKGRLNPGEELAQAALREIKEETGIAGEIRAVVGVSHYTYLDGGLREVAKTVTYYLVDATGGQARANPGEVAEVAWLPVEKALTRSYYPENRDVLERAARCLAAHRD